MNTAHVEYVAHHYLLLALPAFVPAVIVAGVVLFVALRDRRTADERERSQSDKKPE